jgi:hypothetical protein
MGLQAASQAGMGMQRILTLQTQRIATCSCRTQLYGEREPMLFALGTVASWTAVAALCCTLASQQATLQSTDSQMVAQRTAGVLAGTAKRGWWCLQEASLWLQQCAGSYAHVLLYCRALLVDEVLYEPSRLLRKNRKAVLLITGASCAQQGPRSCYAVVWRLTGDDSKCVSPCRFV